MAWSYSLIEKPELAEEFLYKALDDTSGRCAPSFKQEVRAKKGKLETVRRLATFHTSSDWDRIARKGVVQTICGRILSLIPIEGTKGLGAQRDVRRLTDYQEFAQLADADDSARYKVLIEIIIFRCGYQAPDLVETTFRNHPTLRTAAQIGTPIALKWIKAGASAGIGIGADAGGGGGGVGFDALESGTDTLVGGLIDLASQRAESVAGPAQHAAAGRGASATLPLQSMQTAKGHRAVLCDMEDPNVQDALGIAGLGIRHRIAVFQVTPLRYTKVAGSKTRMINAFHKSVMGVRTVRDQAVGIGGVTSGTAALNYLRVYEGAEKQPFITSMHLVEATGMQAWMEPPTYYLRDAAVSTATQVDKLGTNPGVDTNAGHYVEWKTSQDVRATR